MRAVDDASRARAASAAAHPPHTVGRAAAFLPPCFFAVAIPFFGSALLTAPFLTSELRDYFYQTRILALTHMLTLGWISMAMLGVLYRYVPAITKRSLPYPRIAVAQGALFVVGVAMLVLAFWRGDWEETARAAALLVASVAMVCANLWPLLLQAPRRGVAEVGTLVATAFLVVAATLGLLLALDKRYALLGGTMLGNLAAHAHLAAVGWVGVTICALSFRFLPAFLLPTVQPIEGARRVVGALAGAIVVLVGTLLARSPFVAVAAIAVAAALIAYLTLLVRMMASHRMPIDWTARHALAGNAFLLAAIAGGCFLAFGGAESRAGARIAAAYGVAGILGWMSNLIIGISYKLFPGFVAGARTESGRRAVPVAELGVPDGPKPIVFVIYNAGVVATVAGLLTDGAALTLAGTVATAAGGLVYTLVTMRTLCFTFVDPPRPATALRIVDVG